MQQVEGDFLAFLRHDIVGNDSVLPGPFGPRKLLYTDYTASGRPVGYIEKYIDQQVLPVYGNTHSTASYVGRQMTNLRQEARELISKYLNCHRNRDTVIFSGSGSTGAITQFVRLIQSQYPPNEVIVFVGPYEHHSNILPWKEAGFKVVSVLEDTQGQIDLKDLEKNLCRYPQYRLKVGSFSAASNVTGILSDTNAISSLLHRHGALSCWDYATAGPYIPIDMNPSPAGPDAEVAYKDAIFLSTHKLLGGPGTPGILALKTNLINCHLPPTTPGGGTVLYVDDESQYYVKDYQEREEGGTPEIIGSLRAALAFQLKFQVGYDKIAERDTQLMEMAWSRLSKVPNFFILGPAPPETSSDSALERLPIFSFLIGHPSGRFLHYNFVCSVLSDLYGIQCRGGCMCAGPYALRLLGIDSRYAKSLANQLVETDGNEVIRPGFTRINFHYTLTDNEVDYILTALEEVAREGYKLLPLYNFDPKANEWTHVGHKSNENPHSIGSIRFGSNGPELPPPRPVATSEMLEDHLKVAKEVFAGLTANPPAPVLDHVALNSEIQKFRWFVDPAEAYEGVNSGINSRPLWEEKLAESHCPFIPKHYSPKESTCRSKMTGIAPAVEPTA